MRNPNFVEDKWIGRDKLIELLNTLPPDTRISARTKANTGNLALRDCAGVPIGFVDIGDEAVVL